jgi:hypothetical protein
VAGVIGGEDKLLETRESWALTFGMLLSQFRVEYTFGRTAHNYMGRSKSETELDI